MASKKSAKAGPTPAKVVAAPVKPASRVVPVRPVVVSQDRKRGQRVLLRIRASIHVAVQGNLTTIDAATLSVTSNGAVVVMQHSIPAETRLVLEHNGTKECVGCRVARPPRETPEGFHVPLEFDVPAPGFWKIDFPPADWRPDDL